MRLQLLLKAGQSDCSSNAGRGLRVRSNQGRFYITRTTSIAVLVSLLAGAHVTAGDALMGKSSGIHIWEVDQHP
jgi:hypothetical protein